MLLVAVIILFNRQATPIAQATPTPTATVEPAPTVSAIATPSASPVSGGGAATGNITGKLCYPSEFLPEGTIEAKSVNSQTFVSELYPGSENGGGSTYSLAVPAGTYILRYKASNTLAGYHTDVCSTGLETSCAQDNPREHIEITVAADQTVKNVDLCDFYYAPGNAPEF